jgi:hypothetical protein
MSSSFFSRRRASRSVASVLAVVAVAVLVLTVIFAVGCSKPGLVGTWYSADEDVTIEFRSDGKVISDQFEGVVPDYKAEKGKITITVAGLEAASLDYTLNGDTLIMTDPDTGEPATFTRQKSGTSGGVATTVGQATETTLEEPVTSDVLMVDSALFGTWYSAEIGETLEFTSDGLLIVTTEADGSVLQLAYSADGSEIVFSDGTQDITMPYSLEGDVLTTFDLEAGATVTYQRVAAG